MPALPDRHKLEAYGVWDMLLVFLHHEVRQLFVKECHVPAVTAPTVRHNDAKSHRLSLVNPSSNLGPLQYSQVNFSLVHTAQRQLEVTIAAVSDILGPKTDNLPFLN